MTHRPPRVVHMTSVHIPLDKRIFEKECRTLASAGYAVTLIVPRDADLDVDGVHIRAVPRPSSRPERMLRTTRQVLAAALELDADIYHFHDPELIPVGFALKVRGKRVIYDVHENLPGDILHSKSYLPRWMKWMKPAMSVGAGAVEAAAAAAFDGIVTITDGFARRFPAGKTCVISNYPFVNGDRLGALRAHATRERIVVSTGGLWTERCVQAMVDGVGLIGGPSPARMVIAGATESPGLLETLRAGVHGKTLDYLGEINRAAVDELLARSRVSLVMNPIRPDYQDISTNKVYEYMMFGLPVVASPIGSWKSLIDTYKCGLVLKENSAESVAESVEWLLDHPDEGEAMGRRGAAAVREHFNWAAQARKLLSFYERILADDPAPAGTA